MSVFYFGKRCCVFLAIATPLGVAAAEGLSVDLSVQKMEDSNLARANDPVSDSILSTTGTIAANKAFDTQSVNLRWTIQDIRYDTRKDLNAVIQEGEFDLHSQWTHRFLTALTLSRNSYEVDQLEFSEKDLVTKNGGAAKIGYGSEDRLAAFLGLQQIDQTHSNAERSHLDYTEKEGFLETNYHTANASLISLFLKAGSRTYSENNTELITDPLSKSLDFDYQQLELDGQWALSPKTKIKLQLASFKRDGELNKGTGALYSLNGLWNPTEKLSVKLGYQLTQPAIGELSDTPEQEKTLSSSIDWQFTQKIKLATYITSVKRIYTLKANSIARDENFYLYSPLRIDYAVLKNISLRMEVNLRRNESPLIYRDYDSRAASLSLMLHF